MFPLPFSLLFLLLGPFFGSKIDTTATQRRLICHHCRQVPEGYQLSKKYGPIMSMQLGSVPAVSSPQAAELFLKTHDIVFATRPNAPAAKYISYGNIGMVFVPYGPHWRNIRKFVVLELFASTKINSFVGMRREEVGLLVKELKEAAASGVVVDVSAKVADLIENMIYRMLLGRSTKDDMFDLKGIMDETLTLAGTFNLADFVPFVAPLDLQLRDRAPTNADVLTFLKRDTEKLKK